jgi:hypothetical protein
MTASSSRLTPRRCTLVVRHWCFLGSSIFRWRKDAVAVKSWLDVPMQESIKVWPRARGGERGISGG